MAALRSSFPRKRESSGSCEPFVRAVIGAVVECIHLSSRQRIASDTAVCQKSRMEEVLSDSTGLLMNAVQYLSMANLVIETDDFRKNPRKYNRPLLNTLAVGVELFLKYAHTQHGQSIEDVAQRYRHNLWKLWRECPEPALSPMVLETAERFHAHARMTGLAELVDDIPAEFIKALKNLSKLHTAGGSQLRYLAPPGTLATAPGWLTQVFYDIAYACLRRPPLG